MMTDVKEYRRRVDELEREIAELRARLRLTAGEWEKQAGYYRIAEPVHFRHLADACERHADALRRALGVVEA